MGRLNHSALDNHIAISAPAKKHLLALVQTLDQSLMDELVHLSIYGSAVRDEWVDGISDINLLVLVREAHFHTLSNVGEAFARARKKAKIVPMIMTTEELHGSADVFCVKFASIKTHHVTILGEDPLSDLQIDTSELRFVCEFQLRNIAMRMRQFYVQSWGNITMEQDVLLRFFTAALPSLRALARLKGHEPKPTFFTGFDAIGKAIDTDVSILDKLSKTHRQKSALKTAELESLYEQFNTLIQHAVSIVDQHK